MGLLDLELMLFHRSILKKKKIDLVSRSRSRSRLNLDLDSNVDKDLI